MFSFIPNSVLQMSTIFLSIVIEALPFVIIRLSYLRRLTSIFDPRTCEEMAS